MKKIISPSVVAPVNNDTMPFFSIQPQSVTTAVAENGRAVPLSAILQCPSMTFEFGTNRPPFARQKTFSVDLLDRFEVARSNSFAEATGYSESKRYMFSI